MVSCGVLVILVAFIPSTEDIPFLSFRFSSNITGDGGRERRIRNILTLSRWTILPSSFI